MKLLILFLVGCAAARPTAQVAPPKAVVVVSANMEWKAAHPNARMETTPWGETFEWTIGKERVVLRPGRAQRAEILEGLVASRGRHQAAEVVEHLERATDGLAERADLRTAIPEAHRPRGRRARARACRVHRS